GIIHRLNAGRVEAVAGGRSNPTARLTTRQSSDDLADGQRPTQATATSTPSAAAMTGVFASSTSDNPLHGASSGWPAVRLLSPPLPVVRCAAGPSMLVPCMSDAISASVRAYE